MMSIPSLMKRGGDAHQGQAVIITATSAVCVWVTTVVWWWLQRRRLQLHYLQMQNQIGRDDDDDDDVKCNDLNCLRCHSSSSQCHMQAFHSNVILLRRLVKLEPHLFDGMREEIWSVIEDKLSLSGESSKSMPFFSGQYSNYLMVRFWTWMTRARSSSLSYPSPSSLLSTTSTTNQAGQDPTVFFLPGLVILTVHVCNCERWK